MLGSLETRCGLAVSYNRTFLLNVITGEVLRSNIDFKSAFLKRVSQFSPKFQVEWEVLYRPVHNNRQVNALQHCRWQYFHTKTL